MYNNYICVFMTANPKHKSILVMCVVRHCSGHSIALHIVHA